MDENKNQTEVYDNTSFWWHGKDQDPDYSNERG